MKKQKSKPKSYSAEFRSQAIELAKEIGTKEASKQLGVSYPTINRWQAASQQSESSVKNSTMNNLEKENRRLKKELGHYKKINEILKKSTAILSKDLVGGID